MTTLSKLGLLVAATTLGLRQLARGRQQLETLRTRAAERECEMNSLMNFMHSSTEEDKTRMARGLHDELGGVLTSAKIDIAWIKKVATSDEPDLAPRIDRLSRALDEAVNIERRVVETLRPSLLDHLGLGAALDWYVTDACKTACIACHHKYFDDAQEIAPDLAITIYRVVQEAMGGIIAGAKANEIEISLERSDKGLHLSLSHDDPHGCHGLHPQRLAMMRQRALGLGGSFEMEKRDGKGTRLRAFFPSVAAAASEEDSHAAAAA